jgi:DNA-binding CsgD family transcriptional regulator
MTGADHAKREPDVEGAPWPRVQGEMRELPSSLEPWVAALALWAVVDEPTYRLVVRCFGNGRGPEWPFLCSLFLHAGLVEPGATSETFTFRSEWMPALESALGALGGAEAARSKLVDAWLVTPDLRLVAEVAAWASESERWDAVDQIWMALDEDMGDLSTEALRIFRDLPRAARKARPMLSWASGAAESLLADPHLGLSDATLQRLLVDSEVLHADWSMRPDPDAAVTAGTIRMIGERRLPTTQAGESLEAAWRTKQDIDRFIDTRSREGGGPGQTPQAIFRAFSARLALFRGDLQRAVSEARWAALLSDWEPISVLATGIEALAESVASDDGPGRDYSMLLQGIGHDFVVRGLKGVGQALEILADGNDALRRLDREAVDRALIAVKPEAAAVAGVWSVRVALVGYRAALWGDVSAGLKQLSSAIAQESIGDREQEEPLGRAILGRARVLLFIKAGAFGAAARAAEAMGGSLRLLPLARVHLWVGQYEEAIGLAAGGPFEDGLDLGDQYRLKLLRAAAALLDESCDEELEAEAVGELLRMLDNEAFLPFAMLPQPARRALLDLCSSHGLAEHAGFPTLVERLRLLNDAGDEGVHHSQLTPREELLLPMLAGKDSVPQIARKLQVSVNTVRKQVATLRAKFQADTRADLIRKATAHGALKETRLI